MSNQNNIAPASVIRVRSRARYLREQINNGKCVDCEGRGYVFIEDTTRTCSMCGGTGVIDDNSPRLTNDEGDGEWRRMQKENSCIKLNKKLSPIANENDHMLSAFESRDIQPPSDYVACIKISKQPNGKILGASIFIPANFIEGIVDTADSVKLKISLRNNDIILSPDSA